MKYSIRYYENEELKINQPADTKEEADKWYIQFVGLALTNKETINDVELVEVKTDKAISEMTTKIEVEYISEKFEEMISYECQFARSIRRLEFNEIVNAIYDNVIYIAGEYKIVKREYIPKLDETTIKNYIKNGITK